jgi:hypothetical protein
MRERSEEEGEPSSVNPFDDSYAIPDPTFDPELVRLQEENDYLREEYDGIGGQSPLPAWGSVERGSKTDLREENAYLRIQAASNGVALNSFLEAETPMNPAERKYLAKLAKQKKKAEKQARKRMEEEKMNRAADELKERVAAEEKKRSEDAFQTQMLDADQVLAEKRRQSAEIQIRLEESQQAQWLREIAALEATNHMQQQPGYGSFFDNVYGYAPRQEYLHGFQALPQQRGHFPPPSPYQFTLHPNNQGYGSATVVDRNTLYGEYGNRIEQTGYVAEGGNGYEVGNGYTGGSGYAGGGGNGYSGAHTGHGKARNMYGHSATSTDDSFAAAQNVGDREEIVVYDYIGPFTE